MWTVTHAHSCTLSVHGVSLLQRDDIVVMAGVDRLPRRYDQEIRIVPVAVHEHVQKTHIAADSE